jgi:hypothetical protein
MGDVVLRNWLARGELLKDTSLSKMYVEQSRLHPESEVMAGRGESARATAPTLQSLGPKAARKRAQLELSK